MLHVGVVRQGLCRRAWCYCVFHVCVCAISPSARRPPTGVCGLLRSTALPLAPQPRSDACAHLADTKAGARAGRAKAFPALRRRKGPLRQCVGAQSCPEDPFQPCADAKALSGNVWAQDLHVRGVSRRSILAWEIWNGRADTATRPCPVVPRKSPRQSGNRQDLVGSVELTALGIQAKTSSPG